MDVAAIPGMNPPAPEPVAAGTAGADGSGPAAPGGTPDYAALLQYLQYYQKQMGTEEEGNWGHKLCFCFFLKKFVYPYMIAINIIDISGYHGENVYIEFFST